MDVIRNLAAWALANPDATVTLIVFLWGAANVVLSQMPAPKTPTGRRIWMIVHTLGVFISTHSSVSGTFTLPTVVRWVAGLFVPLPPRPVVPELSKVAELEFEKKWITEKNSEDSDA